MSTAVAVYTPQQQVQMAADLWDLAERLAGTAEFIPKALIGRPEAVLATMLKGTELGLGLMQSLSAIHFVEGRPTLSAELMRAVVQARGHEIVVNESSDRLCTISGRRASSSVFQRFTFTIDDARRAGLMGKDVWKKYPQAMLLARASSLLCRAVFADCLAGISYTTEELGRDYIDVDEAQVLPITQASLSGSSDVPVSSIVDHDVPMPGPAQIAIVLKAHGVETSEDRGRAIRQILCRPDLVSSKQLTPDEISKVLETVNDLGDGVPFPWITEDDPPPLPHDPPEEP
jgi:hypothetical protein